MNFAQAIQQATLPAENQHWHKRMDSAGTYWGGPGTGSPDYVTGNDTFLLQPQLLQTSTR